MNSSQSLALAIGLAVFVCVMMPGLARYLVILAVLAVIADLTLRRMTSGAVILLPFISL